MTISRNITGAIRGIHPLNSIRGALTLPKGKAADRFSRFFLGIVILTFTPWVLEFKFLGYNVTGWTWVLAFLFSLAQLNRVPPEKVAFPIKAWLPWSFLLVTYLFFTTERVDAIQSTFQMLTPIVVGCAASTFHPSTEQLWSVVERLDGLVWVVCGMVVVLALATFGGALPSYGFMVQPAICSLLFASMYASFYACGSRSHVWYYVAVAALPVICLVRGPMLAAFACLPLTPAPLGKYRRWALCCMLMLAGILVLYTPRFQSRMFESGHGKVEDLKWNDPNIKTNGRTLMWGFLWAGVEERPWFGHGLNESRTALLDRGFPTYLPHNDWLKLLYEIGLIGTACYLLTMLLQVLRLRSIGVRAAGPLRMLAYGAAGAFIPFAITMLTDNTILYVQFFGNLHFCLIGFVYGHLRFLNTQKVLSRNEQFTRVQRRHPPLQQRTNG